jgi:outer membrane lipoprotein-sorting protein
MSHKEPIIINQTSIFLILFFLGFFYFSPRLKAIEQSSLKGSKILFPFFKGTFIQKKTLKGLKRPFHSEGQFVYVPKKGLLWRTLSPIHSFKLLTKEGVYRLDQYLQLKKEAAFNNDLFLTLFSADEKKLTTFFTVKKQNTSKQNKSSCLELTPKTNTMQTLFKKIHLCFIRVKNAFTVPTQISLIEAKGNHTHIQLTLSSLPLTPKEWKYFE